MKLKRRRVNYKDMKLWIFFLMPVLLSMVFSPAFADDDPQIQSFEKPAKFDVDGKDIEKAVHRKFDVVHEVFLIASKKDRIVVGDMSFNLADGVSTAGVSEGMYVGLKLNPQREVIAIERLRKPD